ncbi:DUF2971 domain-containing protein [Asticcacaulis excentricus]|uniref:DUF2971 domain-containing protein n=1 Tax=Asticcacaulis excentricus TaxID=78587 RepID=UPI001562BBD7|nr:DUF2971 domain-containing protein [Asticcacaulis excentricus]
MMFYYFTTATHGLSNIENSRLKIALIDQLNDPFEFIFMDLSKADAAAKANGVKNNWAATFGIICGSGSWTHPLMWAHYSECHKGICIGIELDESIKNNDLIKVEYSKNRIIKTDHEMRTLRQKGEDSKEAKEFSNEVVRTKSEFWSYESEYRILQTIKDLQREGGNYFVKIGDIGKVSEIIIGARSHLTIAQIARMLPDADIFRAALSPTKYEMVRGESLRPL